MKTHKKDHRFLNAVPPWMIIGAVAVLFPLFVFVTLDTINRQKTNSIRLLSEKGAALIRSFEAGTRTGMRGGMHPDFKLQKLLTETAQQPDIAYLIVADIDGRIIAHSDLERVGYRLQSGLDLAETATLTTVKWRQVTGPDGKPVFEVYRQFAPSGPPRPMAMGTMMGHRWKRPPLGARPGEDSAPQVIFVGLDMTDVETARSADIQHAVLMGLILMLIGFSGIVLLFALQGYRASRASLSQVRAFSDTLVENMPTGLIALDAAKTVARVNPVAESILHLPGDRLLGRAAALVLPKELGGQVERLATEGPVVDREIDCTLTDGRRIPLSLSGGILRDEDRNPGGWVLLFKDLSEVHALRQEIARNQRLAAVGRLAAGVAHEIRNPLSSIKGFATYFKERYRTVPEDEQIAETMIQEVDRLNRVITQMLEFARPVNISTKRESVRQVVAQSIRLVAADAEKHAVALDARFSPQVHAARIDSDRLRQVLLNLYLNSMEAMEAGGRLTVSVEPDAEPGHFRIVVTDTGVGIPEKDLAQVFDPYFTTKPAGTGLGLAIVHNIIEALGGEAGIRSEVGRGTSVTLRLPGLMRQDSEHPGSKPPASGGGTR